MKTYLLAALAAMGIVAPANAAVMTLQSRTAVGANTQFNYQGTLGGDEGLVSGNRFIVFDFNGYVAGSIFSASPDFSNTVELSTMTPFIIPGQTDDPNVANLVFTYTGPDIRTAGGPFAPLDFAFSALSNFPNTHFDAFTSFTVKNNPVAAAGSPIITLGTTQTPDGVVVGVPEPETWAMMFGGFGLLGGLMRRRRTMAVVPA